MWISPLVYAAETASRKIDPLSFFRNVVRDLKTRAVNRGSSVETARSMSWRLLLISTDGVGGGGGGADLSEVFSFLESVSTSILVAFASLSALSLAMGGEIDAAIGRASLVCLSVLCLSSSVHAKNRHSLDVQNAIFDAGCRTEKHAPYA